MNAPRRPYSPGRLSRLVIALATRCVPASDRAALTGDFLEELAAVRVRRGRLGRIAWMLRELVSLAWHSRRTRGVSSPFPARGADLLPVRFAHEFRLAVRLLGRTPAFSILVVGILGLGIGVVTAVFSIVQGVLFAPLPYDAENQLVVVWGDNTGVGGPVTGSISRRTLQHLRTIDAFESIEAHFSYPANIGMSDLDMVVMASRATSGFLAQYGVAPLMGRLPAEGDGNATVLSYALWRGYFGGDPDILGRSVRLEDVNPLLSPGDGATASVFEIVGVMPRKFWAPAFFSAAHIETDLWIPFHGKEAVPSETTTVLHVVGRLAPGRSVTRVQSELDRVTVGLRDLDPDRWQQNSLRAVPLATTLFGEVRSSVWLLIGAGAALLLIVLSNAASLFVTRGVRRASEFSLRRALGASTGRLAHAAAAEAGALALSASAGGSLMAWALIQAFRVYAPDRTPRAHLVELDAAALAFAVLMSLCVAVLLTTVMFAARDDRNVFGSIRGSRLGGQSRLQNLALATQTALTVVLLVGVVLAVRGLEAIGRTETVASFQNRLTFSLRLPSSRYADAPAIVQALNDLHAEIQRIPGVIASGGSDQIPPVRSGGSGSYVSDLAPEPRNVGVRTVTRGYLEAIGVAPSKGRSFTAEDTPDSDVVTLVSRAAADAFWPGTSALGKTLRSVDGSSTLRVVGVVPDLPHFIPGAPPRLESYRLNDQLPWSQHRAVVHVRGAPEDFTAAVRQAIQNVDPDLALSNIMSHEAYFQDVAATPRFLGGVLGLLTTAAILLAAVGTFGVLSQAMAARVREVAIRMAIGARPGDIVGRFGAHAGRLIGAGATVGGILALLAAPLLTHQLYGVAGPSWTDLMIAAAFVTLTALLAAVPVLRRAGRTDPASVLRAE